MLQWLPGSNSEIIWNDRENDRFVSHILDVKTGRKKTVPRPVYSITPDGRTAFFPDFERVNDMRPGYGYAGIPDLNADVPAPDNAGIWRVDLESGEYELIVSIADIAAIPYPRGDLSQAKHYFNHLLISPDGARLEFLNRWRGADAPGFTRMLTCALDGSDVGVLDDNGLTSHFIWHDNEHILAWSSADSERGDFCMFKLFTREYWTVGSELMPRDGHVNCLPDADWLVNDTGRDSERRSSLYLYHMPANRRVDLGAFFAAPEYTGELRCDLHPRLSPDGRRVAIDSVHEGQGRQMYLINIGATVAK